MTAKPTHKVMPTKPEAQEAPSAASRPPKVIYHVIAGQEPPKSPVMVAAGPNGEREVAACLRQTRYQEGLHWKRGLKWVRVLGGTTLDFEPTHWRELPDGWALRA